MKKCKAGHPAITYEEQYDNCPVCWRDKERRGLREALERRRAELAAPKDTKETPPKGLQCLQKECGKQAEQLAMAWQREGQTSRKCRDLQATIDATRAGLKATEYDLAEATAARDEMRYVSNANVKKCQREVERADKLQAELDALNAELTILEKKPDQNQKLRLAYLGALVNATKDLAALAAEKDEPEEEEKEDRRCGTCMHLARSSNHRYPPLRGIVADSTQKSRGSTAMENGEGQDCPAWKPRKEG